MAAAEILKERGAYKIYIMATHGLLSADAPRLIEESAIDEVKTPLRVLLFFFFLTYLKKINLSTIKSWYVLLVDEFRAKLRSNLSIVQKTVAIATFLHCCSPLAPRWWWPTPSPTRCRSCSVPKSRRWTSAWSWQRPSAASTTGSPWPTCSATSPWTTRGSTR